MKIKNSSGGLNQTKTDHLNLVKDLLETNETGFFGRHLHRLEVFNDSKKKQKLEMDQLTSRPN